jgi:hypothetical protein
MCWHACVRNTGIARAGGTKKNRQTRRDLPCSTTDLSSVNRCVCPRVCVRFWAPGPRTKLYNFLTQKWSTFLPVVAGNLQPPHRTEPTVYELATTHVLLALFTFFMSIGAMKSINTTLQLVHGLTTGWHFCACQLYQQLAACQCQHVCDMSSEPLCGGGCIALRGLPSQRWRCDGRVDASTMQARCVSPPLELRKRST